MKVAECKVNRIRNPLGFYLGEPSLSFKVTESKGSKAVLTRFFVSTDENFSDIIYDSGNLKKVSSIDFPLKIKLKPRTRYFWRVYVKSDIGEEATSETNFFETAKMNEPFAAKWITPTFNKDIHPLIRRTFNLDSAPISARLYATGLGVYNFFVNGEKGSNEYMAPGCTAYDKWIQYQTYDITKFLHKGKNTIGAMLGNGWARGRFGFGGKTGNLETLNRGTPIDMFADRFWFLGEIRVLCENGEEFVLGTDETWQCAPSPVTFSNIYDGERYEQQKEIKNWNTPEGDSFNGYTNAQAGSPKIGELTERLSIPVIKKHTFKPKLIITPKNEYVLDMGQNITGGFSVKIDVPKGTQIRLQCGELLQDDCFYRGNLRTALSEYRFISDGRPCEISPFFTFYGYRYIKVSGFSKKPNPDDFMGYSLYSDLETIGSIETGNAKVNRLFKNALWSQRDNFFDIPTDCPQRDERLGWTGDAQVFSSTACFNMDCAAFYDKYCRDMREEQKIRDGAVPFVAPVIMLPGFGERNEDFGACGWADAGTVVPFMRYLYNGGVDALKRNYPGMKAWAEWIHNEDINTGNTRLWKAIRFHFGDWLALDGAKSGFDPEAVMGGTDLTFLCSVYYYYSTTLVAKAAKVLGLNEDTEIFETRQKEILKAIRHEYFTPGGRCAADTQTGLVLSLFFGICPPKFRKKNSDRLIEKLKENDMMLKTGFLGTPLLCRALSENGENEAAYTLLLNEKLPGWLYEVNMGATTIWERWNSVLPNGKISGIGMNSMNHYAYGSIVEWMYRNMCGLRPCEDEPGFIKAKLMPQPDKRMPYAYAKVNTPAGLYESGWKWKNGRVVYDFTVPFGAVAALTLSDVSLKNLYVNSIPAKNADIAAKEEDGKVTATLKAGKYHFAETL